MVNGKLWKGLKHVIVNKAIDCRIDNVSYDTKNLVSSDQQVEFKEINVNKNMRILIIGSDNGVFE